MDRWMVVKGCVPVGMYNDIHEAEKEYMKYDADEIRRISDDDYEPPVVIEPLKNSKPERA